MNRTSAWCELFVDALVHAGVREVVISPGSRSTPLVWAFAANGALRVHSVVDERAAGFFALGMAKVSGDPVALVCTSGSAPAHYFPAVLEASVSRVPLLVIAADRPLVLQDVGANQTVSQRSLFGEHARWFADLGEPDATLRGLRMVKRVALQAVARARGPVPGPVQINARFRKPLEPDAAAPAEHVDAGVAERVIAVRREGFAFHRAPVVVADDGAVDALRVAIGKARRGLVVAGPLSADARTRRAVFYFCAHTGFPLVAEATSQLRFTADVPAGVTLLDAFDAALRSSKGLPVPDLVIQVGRPPTSGAWERFVAAHASIPRWIVGDVEFEDPAQTAQGFVVGDTARAFETLAHRAATKVDGAWVKSLVEHDRNAAHALRAASADGAIAEPVAMQAVVDALPAGAVLSVGNSLPVRWADAWVTCRHKDLRVLSQRGLSGIDGLVAAPAR
ncbi:MAG: 2-succinyl-5-enolpyruvyl-6-hydroxy-3-cyclohexene-1-carboxylic-acid synthase, partial [Myxococcales bacterium]|nr:2-succinyl-5-enolpyruvyl-6-hydroxy-3-cyclohexene-1-carboxylic-acid synthase [Myxococcales bacterium]